MSVPKDREMRARLFTNVQIIIDPNFGEEYYHIRLLGTEVKGDKAVRVLSVWDVPMSQMVDTDPITLNDNHLTIGIVEEAE